MNGSPVKALLELLHSELDGAKSEGHTSHHSQALRGQTFHPFFQVTLPCHARTYHDYILVLRIRNVKFKKIKRPVQGHLLKNSLSVLRVCTGRWSCYLFQKQRTEHRLGRGNRVGRLGCSDIKMTSDSHLLHEFPGRGHMTRTCCVTFLLAQELGAGLTAFPPSSWVIYRQYHGSQGCAGPPC